MAGECLAFALSHKPTLHSLGAVTVSEAEQTYVVSSPCSDKCAPSTTLPAQRRCVVLAFRIRLVAPSDAFEGCGERIIGKLRGLQQRSTDEGSGLCGAIRADCIETFIVALDPFVQAGQQAFFRLLRSAKNGSGKIGGWH